MNMVERMQNQCLVQKEDSKLQGSDAVHDKPKQVHEEQVTNVNLEDSTSQQHHTEIKERQRLQATARSHTQALQDSRAVHVVAAAQQGAGQRGAIVQAGARIEDAHGTFERGRVPAQTASAAEGMAVGNEVQEMDNVMRQQYNSSVHRKSHPAGQQCNKIGK
jgi:hypothetical protein